MAEPLLLLCTLAEVAGGVEHSWRRWELQLYASATLGVLFLHTENENKRLTSVISSDHQNVESQHETGGAATAS